MPSPRRAIAGLVATVLALTACNGSEPAAENTSTASGTSKPSTVAPPTTTETQHYYLTDPKSWLLPGDDKLIPPEMLEPVLAYIRARQAWLRAGMAPVNPDSPDLAATTSGVILDNVEELLREMQTAGEANRPPEIMKLLPLDFDIEETSAAIHVCTTEHVPTYNVQTGDVLQDEQFSIDHAVEMEKRGTEWIVVARQRTGDFKDGDSCGR